MALVIYSITLSNKLTLNILLGLIIAIIIIGLTFVVINDFNYKYFFVALLPNIVPVFTCLGILFFNGFYFSLSNFYSNCIWINC